MCSKGSFNSATKEWEFIAFDPSTFGITSYPAIFDLDMTATVNFDTVVYQYQVTITDVNGCQDFSLNTIQAPQDHTIDYVVG